MDGIKFLQHLVNRDQWTIHDLVHLSFGIITIARVFHVLFESFVLSNIERNCTKFRLFFSP